MEAFFAILTPLLTLFSCMAIGFVLRKTQVANENTATALAKVETWVFCPALAFSSMAISFTPDSLAFHSTNLAFSIGLVAVAMLIGICLAKLFVKGGGYERNIYMYALTFSNLGYMADPLVQAMFGDAVLGTYKFFCLPFTIVIYIWGISILTPSSDSSASPLKRLLNMPTLALLMGMIVGISGIYSIFPAFLVSMLNSLKACMGPVAMIIAGLTIANYDFKSLLVKKKVYVASLFRMVIIPAALVALVIAVRAALNSIFSLEISAAPIYLTFFVSAMPLGMNTVVFPSAYDGDPEPGASMALISSVLSIIVVPAMYMILSAIVPIPF